MKEKPYEPLGVRRSPSRLSPGGAKPCLPMCADQGPKTRRQVEPDFSNACRVALLVPYPDATTLITCRASPTPCRRVTSNAGGLAAGRCTARWVTVARGVALCVGFGVRRGVETGRGVGDGARETVGAGDGDSTAGTDCVRALPAQPASNMHA